MAIKIVTISYLILEAWCIHSCTGGVRLALSPIRVGGLIGDGDGQGEGQTRPLVKLLVEGTHM